jgi:hypothetical protein
MSSPRRSAALAIAVVFAAVPTLAAGPADAASAPYSLSYMTLGNGKKVVARWNPCRAHSYKVNLASVPAAARPAVLAETHAAMRVLAAKSGMTFTYKGATTEVPRVGSTARQSADIVIAYTTPAKTNYRLAGPTAGLGGYAGGWKSVSNGRTTTYSAGINKGFLVIDTPDMLAHFKPGFGTGARRGNLLLHELGHVVGLGHVSNARLLMNPSVTSTTPNGYATGDSAGLALVGRKSGCIPGW